MKIQIQIVKQKLHPYRFEGWRCVVCDKIIFEEEESYDLLGGQGIPPSWTCSDTCMEIHIYNLIKKNQ